MENLDGKFKVKVTRTIYGKFMKFKIFFQNLFDAEKSLETFEFVEKEIHENPKKYLKIKLKRLKE